MTPTARALLALEVIQNSPGISAEELGRRLGVTERAARRYVATLRDAEVPIESLTGPGGGYRVGRGLRLPPMVFTAAEATGLVMAVLEGHRAAADPADVVGGALAKILRALPQPVTGPLRALGGRVREQPPRHPEPGPVPAADAVLLGHLLEACSRGRRVRVGYRLAGGAAPRERTMDVDPWAVVLRHGLWYLLCHSHTAGAQRVLRVDRVTSVEPLPQTFDPPADLDARGALEDHLWQGWRHRVEVVVEAPVECVMRWLPRSLGRLEDDGADRTRLVASTSDPDWYARQLATLPASFRVVDGPELRDAVRQLSVALAAAVSPAEGEV